MDTKAPQLPTSKKLAAVFNDAHVARDSISLAAAITLAASQLNTFCSGSLSKLVSREDVEDAVQEAMIRIIRELRKGHFDPTQSASGWITTIAANECRRILRKNRQERNKLNGLMQERSNLTIGDSVEIRDIYEWTMDRLLRTTGGRALIMRHQCRLSIARIADALGLSKTTIRAQIEKALKQIERMAQIEGIC